MNTLCVIIIARNESTNISACIASAKLCADEVVVFDGGSTDNTVDLAQKAGATVYSGSVGAWQGFGEQRRRIQKTIKAKWIFWLDADERITEELAKEIKEFISTRPDNSILAVARRNHAFGVRIKHCGYYPDRVLRLHAKAFTSYNTALVHEKLELPTTAEVINSQYDLLHYTYNSMEQLLRKQISYGLLWAENKYRKTKKGCMFYTPFIKGLLTFLRKYFIQGGILDGKAGFIISATSVSYTFCKYMALYVIAFQHKQKEKTNKTP